MNKRKATFILAGMMAAVFPHSIKEGVIEPLPSLVSSSVPCGFQRYVVAVPYGGEQWYSGMTNAVRWESVMKD
jgi:hypothetical protein